MFDLMDNVSFRASFGQKRHVEKYKYKNLVNEILCLQNKCKINNSNITENSNDNNDDNKIKDENNNGENNDNNTYDINDYNKILDENIVNEVISCFESKLINIKSIDICPHKP